MQKKKYPTHAEAIATQRDYIASCGGISNIREADDKYNGMNVGIIRAFAREHAEAYLGSINFYGEDRKRIQKGGSIYTPVTDSALKNNCGSFLVPSRDARLQDLVVEWNTSAELKTASAIEKRIDELNGIQLIWF